MNAGGVKIKTLRCGWESRLLLSGGESGERLARPRTSPAAMSLEAGAAPPDWVTAWSRKASSWEGAMSVQFGRLARWSAQRPRQVQWGVTVIMLISYAGYCGNNFEDRPEELWTLQDSELLQALHYMRTIPTWSDSVSRSLILVFESESTDGRNVLTSSFMDSASALHRHLLSTVADDGTSFYDLCTRLPDALGSTNGTMASAPCFVYSFLEFWPPSIPCMDTPAEMLTSQTVRALASRLHTHCANGAAQPAPAPDLTRATLRLRAACVCVLCRRGWGRPFRFSRAATR